MRYRTMTKPISPLILMLVLAAGSAAAAEPKELLTAPDAVLCLRADSLHEAGVGHAAKNQESLRRLGCLRSPAGVPATLHVVFVLVFAPWTCQGRERAYIWR